MGVFCRKIHLIARTRGVPESALKMGYLSDKKEEKQAGAGESVRYLPLLRPVCPLISVAVGLSARYQSASRSTPGGLIAPAGKGVHSDRRPLPLRVVDAHGLTEGTGGGG